MIHNFLRNWQCQFAVFQKPLTNCNVLHCTLPLAPWHLALDFETSDKICYTTKINKLHQKVFEWTVQKAIQVNGRLIHQSFTRFFFASVCYRQNALLSLFQTAYSFRLYSDIVTQLVFLRKKTINWNGRWNKLSFKQQALKSSSFRSQIKKTKKISK